MGEQSFTREDILRVYNAGPDAVVQLIELLLATIAQLQLRIEALESQLSKDSHNSHKPPSSDGLKRMTKSLRVKSTRPNGGQEGHSGHTLAMVEKPDHIIIHQVKRCQECDGSLERTIANSFVQRQVFDIPPLRLGGKWGQRPIFSSKNRALSPFSVPVVFILFAPGIQFRRQTHRNIVHQSVKFIEDFHDAPLFLNKRYRHFVVLQLAHIYTWETRHLRVLGTPLIDNEEIVKGVLHINFGQRAIHIFGKKCESLIRQRISN